ncbi:MAG: GTP 3',8-cyclase MoaA [Bacteroidota bacterium]|nr:GTP 3',8-cyclase MoaA [Bacteroidota bacterium]MDP4196537.1 GTP 3',8-cyclase MoaA [Bacteroidota bacterium]
MKMNLEDKFGREHNYLRVSLTDRCNLKCIYCNPMGKVSQKLNRNELLSFDELKRLIRIFLSEFGIKKIRLTGGEPLLRKDSDKFIRSIGELKTLYGFELALTTNGTILKNYLPALKLYGVDRLNISLDSLKPLNYNYITGCNDSHLSNSLKYVIDSIKIAETMNFKELKINTVILKGINDNEVIDFVNFIKNRDITLRFIEYMPFGDNEWMKDRFICTDEIIEKIKKYFDLEKENDCYGSVAETYRISNFKGKVGFISPISSHFCKSCNRLRIKANGKMKLCLFSSSSKEEIDLKGYLRDPSLTDSDIKQVIMSSVLNKEKEHAPIDELLKLKNSSMLNTGG